MATATMPCLVDCDFLVELGPPPDIIAAMPPPPIPAFLRDPVDFLVASNGTCDLCGWAGGDNVQLVEVTRKYPGIDDMWYFVIVSAAAGAILFGILIVIAMLRCKEAKVKPVHDSCSKNEKMQVGHGGVMIDPISSPPHPMSLPPGAQLGGGGPKALWSGLKNGDNSSAYALNHHPVNPELLSHYERVDYGAVGKSRPLPHFRMAPPPLPLNPPPPTCPTYAGCTPATANAKGPEPNSVCIMGNGDAYYANPESLDGSFENGAFVDSECSMEVRRVAPDGAVVCRRGRPCTAPVHSGGWEQQQQQQQRPSGPPKGRDPGTGGHCYPSRPLPQRPTCRDQVAYRPNQFGATRLGVPLSSSPLV